MLKEELVSEKKKKKGGKNMKKVQTKESKGNLFIHKITGKILEHHNKNN